jgi:hypothetical protein
MASKQKQLKQLQKDKEKEKQKAEPTEKFALICRDLGLVLLQLGKHSDAAKEHEEEVNVWEELGDFRNAAHAARNVGESYAYVNYLN